MCLTQCVMPLLLTDPLVLLLTHLQQLPAVGVGA